MTVCVSRSSAAGSLCGLPRCCPHKRLQTLLTCLTELGGRISGRPPQVSPSRELPQTLLICRFRHWSLSYTLPSRAPRGTSGRKVPGLEVCVLPANTAWVLARILEVIAPVDAQASCVRVPGSVNPPITPMSRCESFLNLHLSAV